jgi:hypothetical protein
MKTPNLKRFALSIITLTVILAVPIVAPADDNHCGAKGTYAYTAFGNTFDGNALGFPTGVASINGTITIDGEGNWSVKEVEVVNGQVVNPSATHSGTYTLNSDCTFVAMAPGIPGPLFVGVVADHGKQIRAMMTIPGIQVNFTNTIRVHP